MIVIVWEFRVKPAARAEFERAYGSNGDWARLFRRAEGYGGTDLVRDSSEPSRYLTFDRWRSYADLEAFHRKFAEEYAQTDRRCASLTESETRIGVFEGL